MRGLTLAAASTLALVATVAAQHQGHGEPPLDPHSGHGSSQQPPGTPSREPTTADPHAGHVMPGRAKPDAPPVAPSPPESFSGPEHAAETIHAPALFRRERQEELIDMHGGHVTLMVLADRLEYRAWDAGDGYAWDVEGWYGDDYDKIWVKSEGEGEFDASPEHAEIQALYSRAINPWFDFQAGVRHDVRPDPERTHLVVGVQGLAPYWFEVDGPLFLSDEGDLTARLDAEYDQLITNKLILQPAIELDVAAQDVREIGVGAGLSTIETGLRLRYEFVPEFAPYIGFEYEHAFGQTEDFARAAGEDPDVARFVIGIRSWF